MTNSPKRQNNTTSISPAKWDRCCPVPLAGSSELVAPELSCCRANSDFQSALPSHIVLLLSCRLFSVFPWAPFRCRKVFSFEFSNSATQLLRLSSCPASSSLSSFSPPLQLQPLLAFPARATAVVVPNRIWPLVLQASFTNCVQLIWRR